MSLCRVVLREQSNALHVDILLHHADSRRHRPQFRGHLPHLDVLDGTLSLLALLLEAQTNQQRRNYHDDANCIQYHKNVSDNGRIDVSERASSELVTCTTEANSSRG